MKKFWMVMALICSTITHAADTPVTPSFDVTMNTEPVSAVMTLTEQKVREAAVKIVASGTISGHGSGSLVKYKGMVLVFTANHVAGGSLGSTYYALKGNEVRRGVLIYGDPLHDISIIYMLEEFYGATPLKYSPAGELTEVGQEITYSGYPSSHQLMTFRGRVAGYEVLDPEGIQILLHTHAWFGCSGSLVYDIQGDIVGILWGIDLEERPTRQVNGNLIWVQPIQAFNIEHALQSLCRSGEIKSRACR